MNALTVKRLLLLLSFVIKDVVSKDLYRLEFHLDTCNFSSFDRLLCCNGKRNK